MSSRPAHRLYDNVDAGANPRQPVDPSLYALDFAEVLKGVIYVEEQLPHYVDPGPRPS